MAKYIEEGTITVFKSLLKDKIEITDRLMIVQSKS